MEHRRRAVPRGAVNAMPVFIKEARGALLTDVDGNTFIDFAGGIGAMNVGHTDPRVVKAVKEQAGDLTHTAFQTAPYEPYVELAEKLNALVPGEFEKRTFLANSGAEAVENAVKIARAHTGRQAVLAFENGLHGRTLLTMTLTSVAIPYKKGFGPFAPEVYRVPAPYPYRGVATDDALAALATFFKSEVDPSTIACAILEPVQGEGGFVVMPEDYPRRLAEVLEGHGILYVDDEVQAGVGRTGPVWAIEHYGVEPDLLVSGKSLGGGLPLAGVTGPAEIMDAVPAGGLGGTFGGNPLACAAALAVLDEVSSEDFRRRADEVGERIRAGLEAIAARVDSVGEVRGLGSMLAIELVEDRETKAPAAALASATTAAARERGLVLLSCGLYGNVIRILVPLLVSDEDLDRGLELLEEALVDAGTRAT